MNAESEWQENSAFVYTLHIEGVAIKSFLHGSADLMKPDRITQNNKESLLEEVRDPSVFVSYFECIVGES